MSDRLKDALEDLIGRMEEPPSWEEASAPQLRPKSSEPGHRWMPLIAGVAAVGVIGVLGALLAGEEHLAADTIPYVQIHWTQEVEMRCRGMDIEDNDGFESATIEMWGPTSDNLYRLDATAPDGTVERQILEVGAENRPNRAWYSLPLIDSESETVFRVTDCAEPGPGGNSNYSMAQPPLFPLVLMHQEFLRYPSQSTGSDSSELGESLAGEFDEQRRDEWRGESVTVFSRQDSGADELGAFTRREELWVDLENRRAERHSIEVDSEVLGRQTVTREVTDRAEISGNDVSFDTAGLHEIFDRSRIDEQGQEPATTTSVTSRVDP